SCGTNRLWLFRSGRGWCGCGRIAEGCCGRIAEGCCGRIAEGCCGRIAEGCCRRVAEGCCRRIAEGCCRRIAEGCCRRRGQCFGNRRWPAPQCIADAGDQEHCDQSHDYQSFFALTPGGNGDRPLRRSDGPRNRWSCVHLSSVRIADTKSPLH